MPSKVGRMFFMFFPTGFGKSVCYQVLPFVFDHKLRLVAGSSIIVVSPLVSKRVCAIVVDETQCVSKW